MVVSYTVDETLTTCSQLIAFLGDSTQLIQDVSSALGNGSTLGSLKLDNKYYTSTIDVKCFSSPADLAQWDRSCGAQSEFGALVIKYNTSSPASLLTEIARDAHLYQSNASMIVLDDESTVDRAIAEKVQEWAHRNSFEVIYLKPSEETREELLANNEKFGVERIIEVLNSVNWPEKMMKKELSTGIPAVDRIVELISAMEGSDAVDAEPTAQDKEAIWQTFSDCRPFDFMRAGNMMSKSPSASNDPWSALVSNNQPVERGRNRSAEIVQQMIEKSMESLTKKAQIRPRTSVEQNVLPEKTEQRASLGGGDEQLGVIQESVETLEQSSLPDVPEQGTSVDVDGELEKYLSTKSPEKRVESSEKKGTTEEMTMDEFQKLSEKMRQNPGDSLGELVGRLGQVQNFIQNHAESDDHRRELAQNFVLTIGESVFAEMTESDQKEGGEMVTETLKTIRESRREEAKKDK